ncbi:putative ribonuclease H-like domain-containing protein, partial [Tanacetum coccineum]
VSSSFFYHKTLNPRYQEGYPTDGANGANGVSFASRIKPIRLFLAFASFMGFIVYQMDVKSAFLYGIIDEEVYVLQPHSFVDPDHPTKRSMDTRGVQLTRLYLLKGIRRISCWFKCMLMISFLVLAVTLTKKIFGNMKRGFRGAPRPLLPAMLLAATTNLSAGQEHPDVAQSQPSSSTIPVPSTSLPQEQSPPPITAPIPASTPTPIPETDPEPVWSTLLRNHPLHTNTTHLVLGMLKDR